MDFYYEFTPNSILSSGRFLSAWKKTMEASKSGARVLDSIMEKMTSPNTGNSSSSPIANNKDGTVEDRSCTRTVKQSASARSNAKETVKVTERGKTGRHKSLKTKSSTAAQSNPIQHAVSEMQTGETNGPDRGDSR